MAVKKKAGDGFPLDRIGQMLFDGCIVAFGIPTGELIDDTFDDEAPVLMLGFIKKLGKSYADITYVTPGFSTTSDTLSNTITMRFRKPSEQLILIDPSQLNSRNPDHEKLKIAAYKSRG